MNKTVVVSAVVVLIAIAVGGLIFLHLFSPESTGAFVLQVTTLVGLVTTFIITTYGLGKVNEKVDTVQKQTNGTLTRRDEKIEALEAELAEYRTAAQRRMEGAHRAE